MKPLVIDYPCYHATEEESDGNVKEFYKFRSLPYLLVLPDNHNYDKDIVQQCLQEQFPMIKDLIDQGYTISKFDCSVYYCSSVKHLDDASKERSKLHGRQFQVNDLELARYLKLSNVNFINDIQYNDYRQ